MGAKGSFPLRSKERCVQPDADAGREGAGGVRESERDTTVKSVTLRVVQESCVPGLRSRESESRRNELAVRLQQARESLPMRRRRRCPVFGRRSPRVRLDLSRTSQTVGSQGRPS